MDPFDPSKLEALSRQEMIIELQDTASTIVHALQMQKDPQGQQDTFHIDLEDTVCRQPVTLLEQLGQEADFSDLRILIERGTEQQKSSVSLILERTHSNGQPMSMYLTHDSATSNYMAEMIVGDEEPVPLIEPIPQTEINQFIASLIFPSKNGDYTAFDALDLTDPSVADNVSQALERSRNDYGVIVSGAFTILLDGKPHQLQYTEEEGQLSDITITRQLSKSAAAVSLRLKNIDNLDDLLADGVDSYTISADGSSTQQPVTLETLVQFIDFVRELRYACAADSQAAELTVSNNDIETLADKQRGSSEYRDANRRFMDRFVDLDEDGSDTPESE